MILYQYCLVWGGKLEKQWFIMRKMDYGNQLFIWMLFHSTTLVKKCMINMNDSHSFSAYRKLSLQMDDT